MNEPRDIALGDLDIALPTASAIANVYFHAAESLGLEFRILSPRHGVGRIVSGDRQLLVYSRWISINDLTSTTLCGNKHYAAQCLTRAGFPVPDFALAPTARQRRREAIARVLVDTAQGRYPLCIKPVSGSHGEGVIPDIRDETELLYAVFHDRRVGRSDTLMESQVSGRHYRVVVAYGDVIGCVERSAPRVTGDGRSTLEELVTTYNAGRDPYCLEHADLGERQRFAISRRHGVSPNDVVGEGVEIILDDRCNIKVGGNIHHVDVDRMSPEVKRTCVDAAALFDLEFAGLDLIGGDVLEPAGDGFMINEINSQPAAHVPVPTMTRDQRLAWPRRLLTRFFEL